MGGNDKRPEVVPDIGWGGRLALALLLVVFGLGALGWLMV